MFFNKQIFWAIVLGISSVTTAPSQQANSQQNLLSEQEDSEKDLERSLEHFLSLYYHQNVKPHILTKLNESSDAKDLNDFPTKNQTNIYDEMQGDQPQNEPMREQINIQQLFPTLPKGSHNVSHTRNLSESIFIEKMRNRIKDNWIQTLKKNILIHVGRQNFTGTPKSSDNTQMLPLNISELLPSFINSSFPSDDDVTEKIRSFYPSCELPGHTDQELWQDDNIMNLFFNFDYPSDEKNANIATATLRLYRLPNNSTKSNQKLDDCESNSTDEEKLIRVSIYWYTKSLRKRRDFVPVKRRLSDSKVIPESSRWVELCVKPATKAWSKGRNLGLAVLVEDQEGNALKAEKYFKGATCMVGASTPKPIPTIIIDAARTTNEFNRIHNISGKNAVSTLYSNLQLPIIDICTLEFPKNYTKPAHLSSLRVNACNLKKMYDQHQKLIEKERLERIATIPEMLGSTRHIRHQRQHFNGKLNDDSNAAFDPRTKIVNDTLIFTKDQLLNFSSSNR